MQTQTTRQEIEPDAVLQQRIGEELIWDPHVKETRLQVSVDRGIVTLTGTVDSCAQKTAAQNAAHRIAGVLDVVNNIRVQATEEMQRADAEIARAVRQALILNVMEPQENIRSSVDGGHVTLEGSVSRWTQRQDAERLVSGLAGVCGVTNKIMVVPVSADSEEIREAIERALERCARRAAVSIQVEIREGVVHLAGLTHSLQEKQAVLDEVGRTPGVHAVKDLLKIDPYF